MTTKTITVTREAYEALKSMKASRESFSKTILRITKRKPLSHFYGILGPKGKKFEEAVIKNRRKSMRRERIERIAEELKK